MSKTSFFVAFLWFAAIVAPQPAMAQSVERGARTGLSFNPDISVVIDSIFYGYDGPGPLGEALEELRGFGHAHGPGDDHHHHHDHGFEKGFNLRHLEVMFSADVDPYFKGWATVAVDPDGAELEEAVVLTTALPLGLQVKLGKFYSDFSRINAQHAHEWNFVDAPLIHHLLLGDHGLNEIGLQLSWLTPAPFFLKAGIEVLQGKNETAFEYHGDGPLPERSNPRLFVGWLRAAPNLTGRHALSMGIFAGRGVRQEEHLGPDGHDDIGSHYLDGYQWLYGADFVYRYAPPRAYGHGSVILEGGYLARKKEVDLIAHNNPARAGLIGRTRKEEQDGIYLQAAYGFAPRWRLGLRGEVIGLTNKWELPSGAERSFDESYRATAMIDWTLTEFSRLRLQGSHGRYDLEDGKKEIQEVLLQAVFSFGSHGAHRF
jgi:hypothetical protein